MRDAWCVRLLIAVPLTAAAAACDAGSVTAVHAPSAQVAAGDDGRSELPSDSPSGSIDAGTSTGGAKDKSAPCKDLQLLCFDIFDMWIINPQDCMTCNGGKGCQGCAIPFAF